MQHVHVSPQPDHLFTVVLLALRNEMHEQVDCTGLVVHNQQDDSGDEVESLAVADTWYVLGDSEQSSSQSLASTGIETL